MSGFFLAAFCTICLKLYCFFLLFCESVSICMSFLSSPASLLCLSVNLLVCASDPKPPQSSSILFSPSVLPLRLLFAYVTLLPAPSAKLRMLVPLFSQNHFKKTHRGGGGRNKVGRQREAEGKKGGSPVMAVKSFFSPFISPPPFL